MDPDALRATLAPQPETSEEDTSAHGGIFESVIGRIERGTGEAGKVISIIDDVVVAINGLQRICRRAQRFAEGNGWDDKISTVVGLLADATSVAGSVQSIRNTTRSFRKVKD